MKAYAAYYDNPIRDKSSSGGLFPCIALSVLNAGGVVYGVSMSDDYSFAEYKRVTKASELDSIIGSKYIQVKVSNVFLDIKHDLENGLFVLYVGTTCTVNGLILFLDKKYANLLTIDILCHGVPSQLLWSSFIKNKRIKKLNFRSKKYGWVNYGMTINNKFTHRDENEFMRLYLSDLCLRPSCYNCSPKKNKFSDISLGDFWGITEMYPVFNDDRGVSLVITRTDNGERMLGRIRNQLVCIECSYEDAVKHNSTEYKSPPLPENRKLFIDDLKRCTLKKLEMKYIGKNKNIDLFMRKIRNVVRRFVYNHKST